MEDDKQIKDYHEVLIDRARAMEQLLEEVSTDENYDIDNDKLILQLGDKKLELGLQSVDVIQAFYSFLNDVKDFARTQLPGYVEPQVAAPQLKKLLDMIYSQVTLEMPNSPDGIAETANTRGLLDNLRSDSDIDDAYSAVVDLCTAFVDWDSEADKPRYK